MVMIPSTLIQTWMGEAAVMTSAHSITGAIAGFEVLPSGIDSRYNSHVAPRIGNY